MTNKEINEMLGRHDAYIAELNSAVDKLQSKSHPPRDIPTKGEVLGWIKRDRYKRRKERREKVIFGMVILLVGGFALFGVLCTIGQVVAALS